MYLSALNESFEIVLTGNVTTNQLEWITSFQDVTSLGVSLSSSSYQGLTSNTTPVTIVSAITSDLRRRDVLEISIYNKDTVAAEVSIRKKVSATTYIIFKRTLQPSDTLFWNAANGWQILPYVPSSGAAVWGSITGTLSSQTDLQNALNLKVDEAGVRSTLLTGVSITGGAITSADTLIGALGKLQNQINLIMTVPTNSVAPVISGSSVPIGGTLSSTTGTWSAIGPITYTYQWRRGASDIVGATSSTYVTVSADVGQNITCRVTASTPVGNANAISNIIVPNNYDADAQAFITAAGITDATQQSAINTLVLDLKGYSIWTKMKAIYPIVGGTASSHAVNLKTPGTYNMTFASGMTHSSTGMVGNGTNAYADTSFNPSSNASLNSHHISFYSRTNVNTNEIEFGVNDANGDASLIQCRFSGTTFYRINSQPAYITHANSDSRGLYIGNRTASNVLNGWKNGSKLATGSDASTSLPNGNHWICAWNNIQSPGFFYYSTKQCAFASIGDGLTDTEALNLYNAVQAYQTTLGRNV